MGYHARRSGGVFMLLMAHMRNRPWGTGSATFLALLLAGLVACTSGTEAPASGPGTPLGLASELASAFCTAQAACCGSPVGTTVPDGSTNRDGGAALGAGACGAATDAAATDGGPSTCVERGTLAASQQLAVVAVAFSEGLLTIKPDVAATCVQAYSRSSCADLAGQAAPDVQAALDSPACADLFTGYIPVNQRCDMTAECISGAYCLSQGTGQTTTAMAGSGTPGICYPFQRMGDPCNTSGDCLPPLSCAATTLTCE
jgi:hypothetical protein